MDGVSLKLNFSIGFSIGDNVKWPSFFHLVGQKGSSFDMIVSKEGKIFKTFILFVWIMKHNLRFLKISFCMGKHCLLIRNGFIEHVTWVLALDHERKGYLQAQKMFKGSQD